VKHNKERRVFQIARLFFFSAFRYSVNRTTAAPKTTDFGILGAAVVFMPKLGPIKRKDLIYYFQQLGFDGPFSGGRHEYVIKGRLKIYIPNPHQGDISRGFLVRILRQAGIEKVLWESL
jgi:predicted RNA binding protein YcfA (HicA-like mRNA interferase family)